MAVLDPSPTPYKIMEKLLFLGIDKITKPTRIHCLDEKYELYKFNVLTNRPKYAIGYCKKNGYSLVKDTLFGYKHVKRYSFCGAPIVVFYDNLEEAKEVLRLYVLDKYCADINIW
jgi:hypothetical protein